MSDTTTTPTEPAKPEKLSPVAKILANIDAEIKGLKDEIAEYTKTKNEAIEVISKRRADVMGLLEIAKAKKLSDEAKLALVKSIIPEAKKPAKKGKGLGKGKRVPKTPELVARIKKMRKDDMTYQQIFEKTGVGIQTIPKWLGIK